MELDVKIKFPIDKTQAIIAWLQSLPFGAVELRPAAAAEEARSTERERKFYALFGAWKSEGETGDDLNRELLAARHTEYRDIEL